MNSRKNTETPRMDRKTLILTVVGALLVIAIIVIAVVLMQRSAAGDYAAHYESAMESYVAGDYSAAADAARLAYGEKPTEEAALLLARSRHELGDLAGAVSVLEEWVGENGSGSEAGALLEKYRAEAEAEPSEEPVETVSVAGRDIALDETTLIITGEELTDADLEAIAQLTELTALSLNGCSLRDISAIAALTKLESLSLEENGISDLSPLARLTGLKSLYLSGNGDIGSLEPLYGLDGLVTLDIRGREIKSGEYDELAAALPGCNILTDEPVEEVKEISLGGVTFTSDVTELDLSGLGLTDISALAECAALTALDVSGNALTDISVAASLPNLRSLDFSDNAVSSVSPLLALTQLETLRLANNSVANIAALSGHTALTELVLDGNPVESLEPLSGLTALRSLSLDNCGLEDADLAALAALGSLESLSVEGNAAVTRAGVDALAEALPNAAIAADESLYSVTLGGVSFPADSAQVNASGLGLTNLAGIESFTSLETLLLSDNEGLSLAGIGSVATLANLELARCGLTDITELSSAVTLRTLNLMQNDLTDVSALRRLSSLEELSLGLNERLADISPLAKLTALRSLSISGTAVTDLSPLASLTGLETLDIEGCRIESIEPLLGLKGLRTLYAAGCGLSAAEIDALGQALPDCIIYT